VAARDRSGRDPGESRVAERSRTSGRWAALLGWEDARRATLWAASVLVDSADLLAQGLTALAVTTARGDRPVRTRLLRA
jgi:hypothetical protein